MLRRNRISLFRDPRLDALDEQMAQEALPGVTSGRALRRSNIALGREKRDDLNRLTRFSGGDPQLVSEGITSINRNVGQTAADAALGAEEVETRRRDSITGRRQNFLLRREEMENQERLYNDQIDADNDEQAWNLAVDLLGLGGDIAGAGLERRLLQRLMQSSGGRRARY